MLSSLGRHPRILPRSALRLLDAGLRTRYPLTSATPLPSRTGPAASNIQPLFSNGYATSRYSPGGGRFLRHGKSHLPQRQTPATAAPAAAVSAQPHHPPASQSSEPQTSPEPQSTNNSPSQPQSTDPVPLDPAVYTEAVLPHAPLDVLQPNDARFDGATRLLGQSALVVTRELEMMNIFLGYEQANRYTINSPTGEAVGYLTEEETGMLGGAIQRQLLRTHRPFRATVMNAEGRPVLVIKRPLTYINSRASVYAVRSDYPIAAGPPGEDDLLLLGEVQQRWHVYRRKYELFLRRPPSEEGEGGGGDGQSDTFEQFAQIDAGLWSWNFLLLDAEERLVGAIDRNFRGFGRELFTDTGSYVCRFDAVGQMNMTDPRIAAPSSSSTSTSSLSQQSTDATESSGTELVESCTRGTRPLSLDERAVALATAVSIDFDYFSRHSSHGSGGAGMFPWFYMGGGGGGGGEVGQQQGGGGDVTPPSTGVGGGGEGGFPTGVAGGTMGQTSYPYDPSESGSSSDSFPRQDTPPSSEGGWDADTPPSQQQQQQDETGWWSGGNQASEGEFEGEGEVWGTGTSDPWGGANSTESGDGESSGGGGFFGVWTDWLPTGDD